MVLEGGNGRANMKCRSGSVRIRSKTGHELKAVKEKRKNNKYVIKWGKTS